MKKIEQIISLAREIDIDESGLRKTIKKMGLTVEKVRRKNDNKVVSVISESDADIIRAKFKLKDLGKNEMTLAEAADELGIDKSYCQKQFKKSGITLNKRRQESGHAITVVSQSQLSKLQKSRSHLAKLDVVDF